MKGKCPNCNTDLRYVKSINQWLCNDCGFTVEGEPITVEQRPKIQSTQKSLNSLELYLLSFGSSIILMAICFSATMAAYPLQTFIALLIVTALFYWFYWGLFTVEGRRVNRESFEQAQKREDFQRQAKKKELQKESHSYGYDPSSISQMQSYLKIVKTQIQDAKLSGDRETERVLKEQERKLTTEIQKIKMFIMTRGFR